MSEEEILEELKRLTDGLLFISESEYPFEIVRWKELTEITAQHLCLLTGQAEGALVETASIDEFFRIATSDESWRSEQSLQDAAKYRELVKFMKERLDELKVYRVGEINVAVYIIGRAETGNWLGVSTRVVET